MSRSERVGFVNLVHILNPSAKSLYDKGKETFFPISFMVRWNDVTLRPRAQRDPIFEGEGARES